MPYCGYSGCSCSRVKFPHGKRRNVSTQELARLNRVTEMRFWKRVCTLADAVFLEDACTEWRKITIVDQSAQIRFSNGFVDLKIENLLDARLSMGKGIRGWDSARYAYRCILGQEGLREELRACRAADKQRAVERAEKRRQEGIEQAEREKRESIARSETQSALDAVVRAHAQYMFGPRVKARAAGGKSGELTIEFSVSTPERASEILMVMSKSGLLKPQL